MGDIFAFKWKEEPKSEAVITETFGQRLKRIRKEKGLSQTELAKITGISNSTISAYEHDYISEPKVACVEWLCKALDITATELLGF